MAESFSATSLILIQMLQEFRSCELLAQLNYIGSACTIAASIYESFYVFDTVLHNPKNAKIWLDAGTTLSNDDELKTNPVGYGNARDAFYKGVFPDDSSLANQSKEESRGIYTRLSAFRHHNPAVRNKMGFLYDATEEGSLHLWPYPAPDRESFIISAYALNIACERLILSAGAFRLVFCEQGKFDANSHLIQKMLMEVEETFSPYISSEADNS